MLSAWSGMRGIVYISGGVVAPHSFGEISSIPKNDMTWLVSVFWKELFFMKQFYYLSKTRSYLFLARNKRIMPIYF